MAKDNDPIQPDPAPVKDPVSVADTQPMRVAEGSAVLMSDDAARRASEQRVFDRKLVNDDARREKAGIITMVAVAGFTIHDDPDLIDGRVIVIGQEFEISAYDLPLYTGRARPKALDAPPGTVVPSGVTIQNG